jgi:diadenosine tetraphosphate (Ap4A) HIT family hydrolase
MDSNIENKECPFCQKFDEGRIIYQDSSWVAIYDNYPVSEGHVLLIPKRHVKTYFELNYVELASVGINVGIVKRILDKKFKPDGYNIGINCGEAAGQTVPHCHIHIIPRYNGDVKDPRGGVRGVIPEKQKY